ncbi:MAG: hypothetical protein ACYTFG_01930 [Planctomycetota bacterium]|jgi:hypothetical protein
MNQAQKIILALVALLLAAGAVLMAEKAPPSGSVRGSDDSTGVQFEYFRGGSEEAGRKHVLVLRAGGGKTAVQGVRAYYRLKSEKTYGSLELQGIGGGDAYVGELPGQEVGEWVDYYFVIDCEPGLEGGGGGGMTQGPRPAESSRFRSAPRSPRPL